MVYLQQKLCVSYRSLLVSVSLYNCTVRVNTFLSHFIFEGNYENEVGEQFANTTNEASEKLNLMTELYTLSGKYYSRSEGSRHISRFIKEQRDSRSYQGRQPATFRDRRKSVWLVRKYMKHILLTIFVSAVTIWIALN